METMTRNRGPKNARRKSANPPVSMPSLGGGVTSARMIRDSTAGAVIGDSVSVDNPTSVCPYVFWGVVMFIGRRVVRRVFRCLLLLVVLVGLVMIPSSTSAQPHSPLDICEEAAFPDPE